MRIYLLAFFALSIACTHDYVPKPLGYNRLLLPDHEYHLSPDTLPYRFMYSTHADLLRDTSWVRDRFWVELNYPELKATIHLTYKDLNNDKQLLREYLGDSYTLTAKHQIKAYAIDESVVHTPLGKTAMVEEINGQVPSQFQFTLTDSSRHFLRGAVYFYTHVNNDSLAPAINYVKIDAMQLINSVQWRTAMGWK